MLEPFLHGSAEGIDALLDRFEQGVHEAMPDPETWGTSRMAQQINADAEAQFAPAWTPPAAPESTGDDETPPTIPA